MNKHSEAGSADYLLLDNLHGLANNEHGDSSIALEAAERIEELQSKLEAAEARAAMMENRIELLTEDLECVHLYLDDIESPRCDNSGVKYSIVGRIKCLIKKGDMK